MKLHSGETDSDENDDEDDIDALQRRLAADNSDDLASKRASLAGAEEEIEQPIEALVGADAGAGVSMDDDDDDGDEGDRAAATAAGDLDASGDGKVGKRDGDDDADSDARASAAAADAGAGEGKKADDDGGADGGGARAAATAADDLDASGDGNVGKRDGDDDAGGDRKEDPDWVRTGVGSSVFLRRGPGPVVEFDAEKVQFWTGYSYKYQEVLLNDKYDHSSLLSPGAVMMVASKGGSVIAIVSTATGHVVSVTPNIGVYTFSADVAGPEHAELCKKAAGHVKDSGVLLSLSDTAFTVKLVPMTLHEATEARPPRKAAAAAAARRTAQMDGDGTGTPAPSAAAAAAAEEDARAVAEAAAARRADAGKPPKKKPTRGGSKKGKNGRDGDGDQQEPDEQEQDERPDTKRAAQPLVIGDYVRRDDGTVSKIVTASTKVGWSKTASGRKAKRGSGSELMDPKTGLDAYEERLKQISNAARLQAMSSELESMQQKIDDAIAEREAAKKAVHQARAGALAAQLELERRATEVAAKTAADEAARVAAAGEAARVAAADEAARVAAAGEAARVAAADEAARTAAASAAFFRPAPAPAPAAAPAVLQFDMAGHSHAPMCDTGAAAPAHPNGPAVGRPTTTTMLNQHMAQLQQQGQPPGHLVDMMQLFLMQRDQAQRAADRHDADMMLFRMMRK